MRMMHRRHRHHLRALIRHREAPVRSQVYLHRDQVFHRCRILPPLSRLQQGNQITFAPSSELYIDATALPFSRHSSRSMIFCEASNTRNFQQIHSKTLLQTRSRRWCIPGRTLGYPKRCSCVLLKRTTNEVSALTSKNSSSTKRSRVPCTGSSCPPWCMRSSSSRNSERIHCSWISEAGLATLWCRPACRRAAGATV